MALTTSILKSANASIQKLFSDGNLSKEVTYKSFQGSSFDTELGMNVDVYINHTVLGIYTEKEKLVIPAPGVSPITATESAFLFRYADLPQDPSKRDYIVDGNSSYAIEAIKKILNIAFRIRVKGI